MRAGGGAALPGRSLKRAEPLGGGAADTRGSGDQYRPISRKQPDEPGGILSEAHTEYRG